MGLMWSAAIIWTARINTGLELVVFSGCRAMVDSSIAPSPSTPTSSGVLLKGFWLWPAFLENVTLHWTLSATVALGTQPEGQLLRITHHCQVAPWMTW